MINEIINFIIIMVEYVWKQSYISLEKLWIQRNVL